MGTGSDFRFESQSQAFNVYAYGGGYLDFIKPQKPISRENHDFRDCRIRKTCLAPFDDLIRHWIIMSRSTIPKHDEENNVLNIMKPAFQLAASETANFFEYVRNTLNNNFRLSGYGSDISKIRRQLEKCIFLDSTLSRHKIALSKTKDFVQNQRDLREDFRRLMIDLHHNRAECDSQIQHITSILQSHDSEKADDQLRETVRQADYLRYLTIIALIYAPFAIACAVFSMPETFVPAAHYLYGFLPVTIVVCLLFLLLVLPESRDPLPVLKAFCCGRLSSRTSGSNSQKSVGHSSRKTYSVEEV